MREPVVEGKGQKVLHPEPEREFEPVVFWAECDTFSDLDIGHVAELGEEFSGGIGLDNRCCGVFIRVFPGLLCQSGVVQAASDSEGCEQQESVFFHVRSFCL